jgi:hypothetical protein
MYSVRTSEPRLADAVRSGRPRRRGREKTTIKSFTAITSVCGKEIRFVGNSWEDAGFRTNVEGNPIRDRRGNTISRYTVEEIDERDSDQLVKAFGDGDDFMGWMLSEGISEQVAKAVAGQSAQ